MSQRFDRASRTYLIDDARLLAFRALPCVDKLRWQEDIALFIHMTRATPAGNAATTDAAVVNMEKKG